MTEREKIIDRISKLKALTGSANVHESAQAGERVKRLMQKHGIAESEIVTPTDLQISEWPLSNIDFSADWRLGLLTAISMRYGCKALRMFGGSEVTGAVFGPKGAAEAVTQIFVYFEREILDRSKVALEGERYVVEELNKRGNQVPAGAQRVQLYERDDEDDAMTDDALADTAAYNAWSENYFDEMKDDYIDSFCRGATISLQDRILSGDLDLMSIWRKNDEEEEKRKAAAKEAHRKKAALIVQEKNAVAKRIVDQEMHTKATERFSGRGRAADRYAFSLGKLAGTEITMPEFKSDVLEGD